MKNLILFFCCVAANAVAQSDMELFQLKYSVGPLNNQEKRDALHTFDFNVKFPLVLNGQSMLAGGFGYEALWTNQYPLFGGQSVEGISTQLLFNRTLRNGNSLLSFVSAGIYSDFSDVSSEDFRYTMGVRYRKKVTEKFNMSYGIAFSGQFFGLLVAPFIDFDWNMTDKFRLSGPIPLNTRLRYTLTPKSEISFFLKPDNATYRLSKEDYESRYFQKKQWNVGLGFGYQIMRHWQLTARGGYSVKRKFEIYEASQTRVLSILTFDLKGEKRTPTYQYTEDAFFAEAMLSWVISKD